MSLLLVVALLVPSLSVALAQPDPSRPNLRAHAVESNAIRVDGRLDEAAWATAAPASGFVQMNPNPGQPASESTEARVAYDADALYVGMRMLDSQPTAIDTQLGRRDAGFSGDWAFVGVDSYGEGRTGFVFAISAGGVQRDILLFDDVRDDESWDAVWDAAVTRDGEGWTAEFRIPLSQLRFSASEGPQTWGIQFGRDHHRTNESSFWAPLLPSDDGMVSRFGELTGLRGLKAPRSLELLPYVAAGVTRAPGNAADPYYRTTAAEPRAGLDLKYGLTGDVTLTATVNPDFGQVEADPAQVNLGAFELFVEERRPFFVEGVDIFSFGRTRAYFTNDRPQFLYTRRIGRSPQRDGFVPDAAYTAAGDEGDVYSDAPVQTPILGAAKVSGRVGRFSVGVLNALTPRQMGRFQAIGDDGVLRLSGEVPVEPLTNYTVARARGTFGQTLLGGAATAVVRERGDDGLASLLPSGAFLAEADVEHRLASDWVVSGVVAGSRVQGSTDAIRRVQRAFPRLFQRPDADYLSVDSTATTLHGLTGEVALTKTGGTHWLGSVTGAFTTPGFDANALGFQSRADIANVGGIVIYQQNEPVGPFLRYSANLFAGAGWNFGGDRTNTFVGGNLNGRLRSFWSGGLNMSLWPRTTSDRLTRGGPLATDPAGLNLNLNASSDSRKMVSGYAWTGMNRNELGSWYHGVEVGAEIRPTSALQVSIGPGLDASHTARQFVTAEDATQALPTFGRRYVFGEVDQVGVSMSVRGSWTFTPRLTLQLFARPFIAAGRFDRFSQMTEPGQLRFPVYGEDFGTATRDSRGVTMLDAGDGGEPITVKPDFTVRALQGNAVLRWEYRPGSALFVVWQQSRSGSLDDGDLRLRRDVRGLWRDDDRTNTFLVKLSYWL